LVHVRLCVLVSGSGTILESMLAAGVDIALVGADRECRAVSVATDAGIEAFVLDRSDYGGFSSSFDREAYTRALSEYLVARDIDLVAMAGFGTITTASFHEAFPERVLNTHPSLLPAFKGWHAVRDALAAGATETGCTVHIATAQLDDGPILAQRVVPIDADDDEASLHERIKSVERALYPEVVLAARDALARGESIATLQISPTER